MKKFLLIIFLIFLSVSSLSYASPEIINSLINDGYKYVVNLDSNYYAGMKGEKTYVLYVKDDPKKLITVLKTDEYDKLDYWRDYIFATKNTAWYLYYEGKLVSAENYSSVKYLGDKYVLTEKNKKYGFICKGIEVLKPLYDEVKYKNYDYTFVKKNDKYALFHNNKKISDFIFDKLEITNKRFVLATSGSKYSIYYGDGLIINSSDSKPIYFSDSFAFAKNNKYGVVNIKGETIIPNNYDEIKYCNHGYASYYKVKSNGKTGTFDTEGKLIVPVKFDDIQFHKDNLYNYISYIVISNKKKGIYAEVNMQYKQIIPAIYDNIESFSGYWYVEKNNKKGGFVLSQSGDIYSTPISYDDISYMSDSFYGFYFKVKVSDKYGLYDSKNNRLMIPVEYDDIIQDKNADKYNYISTYIIKNNGKQGVFNTFDTNSPLDENKKYYNKILVPVEFDNIEVVNNGYIVSKNGKKGFYHVDKGKMIPVIYDTITYDETGDSIIAKSDKKTIKKAIPMNHEEITMKHLQQTMDFFFPWLKGLH